MVPTPAHSTTYMYSSRYHLHVCMSDWLTPYHRSGLLRWDNPPVSWPAWAHWHDQSAPCQSCSDRPEVGNTALDETILQVSTCKIAMCKKSGSKSKHVMWSVRLQNAFWNPCSAQMIDLPSIRPHSHLSPLLGGGGTILRIHPRSWAHIVFTFRHV